MIGNLFNELLYRPFFNALFLIYGYASFRDMGLAIIILTVLVRLALYPLFRRSIRHQTILQRLQPKVQEIQKSHKGDKQKQTQVLLELYKEHKVNPFSGFLLLIAQIPVFLAMYWVFSQAFNKESFNMLYSFVPAPQEINPTFMGLINLHETSIILVALAAIFQFLQGYYSLPPAEKDRTLSPQERAGRQMIYLAPLITVIVLWSFPSAIALYWATTAVLSLGQQLLVRRHLKQEMSLVVAK